MKTQLKMREHGLVFPITLFCFQLLLLGLFAGYVDYDGDYTFKTKGNMSAVNKHEAAGGAYYTCKLILYFFIFKYSTKHSDTKDVRSASINKITPSLNCGQF